MKKSFVFLLFLLSVAAGVPCCVSCTDDPTPPEQQDPQPDPSKPQPGTYTFTVSPLKGKWEAGDKIFVHGSYGPVAQMITLTAADISADGKTASAYLDEVTKYPLSPDGLYAAWPGEDAYTGDELLDNKTYFPRTDKLLAVAYLDGTDFAFKDAVCGLRFKASGYSEFCLAANNRSGVHFSDYAIDYNSTYSAFFNFVTGSDPFLKGSLTDGTVLLWFPGSQSFSSGYTLYLGNDGTWPVAYTVEKGTTLPIGEITDLGDITSALKPYDGPGPNMPEMGTKTKYTVAFNELSGLCLSKDGDFLWGVDDNGGLGKISFTGEVLWKKSFGGEYEAITMDPATGDLLIGEETAPAKVTRIAAPDYTAKSTLCTIPGTTGMGNSGMEGLTYYKDGMAYGGMQTGSYLYLFKLSTGEVVGERKGLRTLYTSITEIADLCYDPLTDWLWVIDSESKKITVLTGDASQLLGVYSVKGIDNPEALCVDHEHSCVWVGDDYGSTSYLYRFDFTGLDDAIIQH